MGAMTALVVVVMVVAVACGVAVARYTSRDDREEVSSIQGYHHALRTLEDVTHRTEHPALRLRPPGPASPAGAPGPGGVAPSGGGAGVGVPAVGSGPDGAGRPALTFDETSPPADEGGDASWGGPGGRSRARRRELSTMERRRGWRPTAVVLSVVAVLAIVAAAYPALDHHGSGTPPSSHRVVTTPGRGTAHAHGTAGGGRATGSSAPATTTTTTTSPSVLAPVSSASPASATYGAPSAGYVVSLAATGRCWVMATNQATGSVLWTGMMEAGQVQQVLASGTVTVVLGAASDVTMKLVDSVVQLPAGFQSPFTATFTPGG